MPITGTLGNSRVNRKPILTEAPESIKNFGNKILPNLGFRSSSLKPAKVYNKKKFFENKRNS